MLAAQEKPKLLVIDDELGPRESLRFLFKDRYDVICVENVDGGLQHLRCHSPEVVILDIKMPGKNGIDGLHEIREIDPLVSVIMLTGFGNLETAQKAIRLGANDYMKKPFDMREMRDTVERYIQLTRIARRRDSATRELAALNAELQREVRAKSQMASLGQASSEFVHDLRNPLTVISGYVQLLMQEMQEANFSVSETSRQALEYLQVIDRNVARCNEMAELWRTLGRQDALQTRPTDVGAFLAEVHQCAGPIAAAHRGAQLQLRPGPEAIAVRIDALQMSRALQNLVSNAFEALPPQGGLVSLGWERLGDRVDISVEDNGAGIPAEHLERIFKAYFTTKGRTGGMGMGLYIARQAVELHGGSLRLINKPDGGVKATITLPIDQPGV